MIKAVAKEGGVHCLDCGSEEMKAFVTLSYYAPLSAHGFGVKVAGLNVTKIDVRDAWNKMARRPVHCLACGTKHVYDVESATLILDP